MALISIISLLLAVDSFLIKKVKIVLLSVGILISTFFLSILLKSCSVTMGVSWSSAAPKFSVPKTYLTTLRDFVLEKSILFPLPFFLQ